MHYTEEQYSNIENNINAIEKIVSNKSGVLSPSLIKIIEDYGKQFFPSFCAKCSSGRYNIVTRLYRFYIEDKMERQNKIKETEVKNGTNKKRKGKKS